MTVKKLIQILKNYDGDTEVWSGTICKKGLSYRDLFIEEFNQNKKLVLWIGYEDMDEEDNPPMCLDNGR